MLIDADDGLLQHISGDLQPKVARRATIGGEDLPHRKATLGKYIDMMPEAENDALPSPAALARPRPKS